MPHAASILVINSGSSSIKFALIDSASGRRLAGGLAERLDSAESRLTWHSDGDQQRVSLPNADHSRAMAVIIDTLTDAGLLREPLTAIGHRVVHGGEAFTRSTIIDDDVLAAIEACTPLAPLHNPANILGIRTAQALFPDVPQVAVFDTAFHQTLPPHAFLYPVPYDLYTQHGVRRYGFHGTSHRYVTQRAAAMLGLPLADSAFISAHLGNGCSAAAVLNGRSVDTTMGLTPLEGLMMGTRSGDVDPALHQFLQQMTGQSLDEITHLLNKKSGLLGVSGLSNDMRTLVEAADAGHQQAEAAIALFCYRLAKAVAGLMVGIGRIDALIFTGGIGENAAPIRARTLHQLQHLGFAIDEQHNQTNGRANGGIITRSDSPVAIVVPTDEEAMIAQDSAALVLSEETNQP